MVLQFWQEILITAVSKVRSVFKMQFYFYLDSRITAVLSKKCKKLNWIIPISRDMVVFSEGCQWGGVGS